MTILLLILGLIIAIIDIYITPKSLRSNILKRVVGVLCGTLSIIILDKSYLSFNLKALYTALVIGSVFLITHLFIAKGVKLKKRDVNSGLISTCLLIYLLELPSEEFIYRGIIFITFLKIWNPVIAIILSSLIFLVLHLKTWNDHFVWIGSFTLGLVCCLSVLFTKSIWTAIIIHNLNDFGYLTLVNKRNIFDNESL